MGKETLLASQDDSSHWEACALCVYESQVWLHTAHIDIAGLRYAARAGFVLGKGH